MIRKILITITALLSLVTTQEHFILEIDETGESTLFLFEDSITTLGIGDEIGIFANDLLVGAGVWHGEDLPIIAIHGVDLSDFGGPVLPGASQNDSMEILVWSSFSNLEYIGYPIFSFGEGAFNGLFTAISSLDCIGDLDACGVCIGPGNIFECGCYDIPVGECDCEENILDCDAVCGGNAIFDECDVCNGDNSSCSDCLGVPNGEAILDECDICNGDNSSCSDCLGVPNGEAILDECNVCEGDNSTCSDCLGVPNGAALIDNCGICDGDSSLCDNPEAVLSFYDMGGVALINISYDNLVSEVCLENVILSSINGTSLETAAGSCISFTENTGNFPIYMKNTQAVAGFQFNITGLTILGASGGAADAAGFTISASESIVLGFSFSGSSMNPSGDFYGCLDSSACNYYSNATINDNSCEYPETGFDCDGNCLDQDCLGQCGGDAIIDECGVCEGPGAILQCEDGTFVCNESDCIVECDDNEFDCGDGLCIDVSWECNDMVDCTDGSDEANCDNDGGGGGGDSECSDNEIEDCFGNCGPSSWLGDGYCDESMTDFNCLALAYDMGDCQIEYTEHILPIILANCTGYCHTGASAYDGGLNLETYGGLMDGGSSGPAVIPYNPNYSLIIQKLNGTAIGEQMPYGSSPLEENYINTIYYWIQQGAFGSDDDAQGCANGDEIEDCTGECVSEILLGDGNCDDGEEGEADFNCSQYIFDNTDCPVGILEFGNYTYDNNNNSGSIEVLMDCEFPVSNFDIEILGVEISDIIGGTSSDFGFDVSYTASTFSGNAQDDYIPPNSGLLGTILFNSISQNATELCFNNSLITTSAGYEYAAVLGSCISINMLGDEFIVPDKFSINKIFPNPFNPITTISYSIPNPQIVSLNIYTLKGEKIQTLINEFKSSGNYDINWDASSYASGVYIIQLNGSETSITQKITLSK